MSNIVITIKLLIGFYTVSISDEFIVIAHYPEELTETPRVISVIDMDDELSFKFKNTEIIRVVNLADVDNQYPLRVIDRPIRIGNTSILGYDCEIFSQSHEVINYLQGKGNAIVRSQAYYCEIPLLRKYLYNNKVIEFIPYFGTINYNAFKKFRLKLEESTHKIPTLIFEVVDIQEKEEIHPRIASAIFKVKKCKK